VLFDYRSIRMLASVAELFFISPKVGYKVMRQRVVTRTEHSGVVVEQ
jgi:hypothetical protein